MKWVGIVDRMNTYKVVELVGVDRGDSVGSTRTGSPLEVSEARATFLLPAFDSARAEFSLSLPLFSFSPLLFSSSPTQCEWESLHLLFMHSIRSRALKGLVGLRSR
jgi:hypothetical protein